MWGDELPPGRVTTSKSEYAPLVCSAVTLYVTSSPKTHSDLLPSPDPRWVVLGFINVLLSSLNPPCRSVSSPKERAPGPHQSPPYATIYRAPQHLLSTVVVTCTWSLLPDAAAHQPHRGNAVGTLEAFPSSKRSRV